MSPRFHSYPGLADPKREVEAALRPALLALRGWARRYHPAREQFWAILTAQQALNELALTLTGEPLYRAAEQHGRGFGRPDEPA